MINIMCDKFCNHTNDTMEYLQYSWNGVCIEVNYWLQMIGQAELYTGTLKRVDQRSVEHSTQQVGCIAFMRK